MGYYVWRWTLELTTSCHSHYREAALTGEHASSSEILCWGWPGTLADTLRTICERAGNCRMPLDKIITPFVEWRAFQSGDSAGTRALHWYKAVDTGLWQQFAAEGNELEWQHQLQSRTQRPGEKFAEHARHLHVLADKAYPRWSPEQQQGLLRNHFFQGIHSPTVQLHLMQEMPCSLD